MSAAPQMWRFLTTLALVSSASLAATNNLGQEVKLRGAAPAESSSKWQTKELRALMKSDAAKLKNQIKLERMFALASASASMSDKSVDKSESKDKKKSQAVKPERLRAEVEGGGGSGATPTSTPSNSPPPRSQPPKQDKEEPSVSLSDSDIVGFDLPPESMTRASGMMRTTVSPVDGSPIEIQPAYAQGARFSANSGYHLYEAGSPATNEATANDQVEVSSRYAPTQNEYLPLGQAAGRGSSHIRVVFNNNPQFIIGRGGHDALPVSVQGSGGTHSRLGPDDYSSAESSVDETKVALSGPKSDHQPPCAKDRAHSSHAGHMELINLLAPTPDTEQQKQLVTPEQQTVRQPLSPPPPPPQASPPAIAQIRTPDFAGALSRHPDDEQVNLPFEEMAKSNIRPPLRMVISMRNKDGDLMKVPINLQGSRGSPSFFDLGPRMRIHFEPQVQTHLNSVGASFTGGPLDKLTFVDENTPLGGDVFDPANVKPFAKVRARSREEPVRMQEKVAAQRPTLVSMEPPDIPAKPPMGTLLKSPQLSDSKPPAPPVVPVMEPATQIKVQPITQVGEPFTVQQSEERRKDCDKSEDPFEGPLLMPPTHLFQNKTLASMFVEFQRALTEQMQIQSQFPMGPPAQQPVQQQVAVASSGHSAPLPQQQQLSFPPLQMRQDDFNGPARPMSPQETDMSRLQRAMQLQEQQEDLVVAMMAANASNPASIEPGKQMSMTVITPPRGTSLEEAIRMHAGDTEDRTVAILHSSSDSPQPAAGGALFRGAGASAGAGGLAPADEHSRPFPVNVRLRKPVGSQVVQVENSLAPEPQSSRPAVPQDPDGFASASNLNLNHHQRRWPYELDQLYNYNYQHNHHRYRRSVASEFAGSLEPADRLAALVEGRQRQLASAPATNKSLVAPESSAPADEDPVVGAASEEHQNEVESDADSASDSSDEEPSSSGADSDMEARSDADLDGDSSESDLDDTPDESSEFDSDDEPYNQVASSERDYNTPSFEIPQIDLSADSLKQKGCRTVLREIQEIPLNGLEATRADGAPGSGFVAGRPVVAAADAKLMIPAASSTTSTTTTAPGHHNQQQQQQQLVRTKRRAPDQAGSRANLINSRKVTSIVMTKECLFPDGETQSASPASSSSSSSSSSQQAGGEPPVRLAPGLQVSSLSIGRPATAGRAEQVAGAGSGTGGGYTDWSTRAPAVSSIRRRSVQAPSERDFYVVSDSRRNEVAHKMYKPPSDTNPYHSLVYTSKNGADPDTEPDEPTDDDSFGSSAESGSRAPGIKQLSRLGSSPRLLSARERAALEDSDREDTDPAPERPAAAAADVDAAGSADAEAAAEEEPDEGSQTRQGGSNQAKKLQLPQPKSFGKSLRIEHSVGGGGRRPKQGAPTLGDQLRSLKPGMHGYVARSATNHKSANKPATSGRRQQVARADAERRHQLADEPAAASGAANDDDDDDADDEPAARGSSAVDRKSDEARADEEDSEPDADPDYNPKESRLKLNGKPKRTQKSFAYVHRNTPKKGSKKRPSTDDDFVVSYGRGNVQTEHEDYDSERDSGPPPASLRNRRTLNPALGPHHHSLAGWGPHPGQFGLRVATGVVQQHQQHQPSARQPLTLIG